MSGRALEASQARAQPGVDTAGTTTPSAQVADLYRKVRTATERLAAPLSPEDCTVQSMADASPVTWHLGHVSWFFEIFCLEPHTADYRSPTPAYRTLFNSYYQGVGPQHPRPRRGLLTRPSFSQVVSYRRHVDDRVSELLDADRLGSAEKAIVELGLHHEQQHQELILTDVKHLLAQNPLGPSYRDDLQVAPTTRSPARRWLRFDTAIRSIGHGGPGFHFDNEAPRHDALVPGFEIATRPVTNGEYREFMADGGYERPELWLSDGWDTVCAGRWGAPCYWRRHGDADWHDFTLAGICPVDPEAPVAHVSYFEADAYARWAGARLPSEQEWETAARGQHPTGNFAESDFLKPIPARAHGSGTVQLFGDVWEWTRSPYSPYPRYRPPSGVLGEYNGKFMCNQFVLRGGSCATPRHHVRPTYRNFFPPAARWQFSGIRLARDLA